MAWSRPEEGGVGWSSDPLLSVLLCCERGEVLWSPVREGSAGMRPSFIRFFCFIRRFWNQILT